MNQASNTTHGTVAVLTLDNPPVNGLGHALRQGIVEGLDRALADPAIKAVVLVGAGKAFSGGADIREFNTPKMLAEPTLHTVIRAIEAATKPVVAAVNGTVMGGGLELALACHYRVAVRGAHVALPEVKLGLLPGAGGTQRLPRVVGVERALNMIVSGVSVPSEALEDTALFDQVVSDNVLSAAVAFAEKVADARPLKLIRDIAIDYPNADGYFQFARNTVGAVSKHFPAPLKCIEAVAAAVTKPFDEGLQIERALFVELVQSPESKALRHAFFAERAASKIPDVPDDTPRRAIRTVAVIGAGTMGGGIAMNFLNAGIPVALLEVTAEALDKGVATIRRNYDASAKKGRLAAEAVAARMGLLTPTRSYADVGSADLVIEAVFEDMAVKEQVFRTLDEAMKPGAILATNTSTLDVNRIASFTRRPQDVVGLHFFSPANVMKLLEIVRGAATGRDVLATVMALSKQIGKTGVVAGVCDGFIGNRMLEQYLRQAMFLLEEGALPEHVDRALEQWGMAMGPFRMSDLAGNDVGWYIRKRRYVERPHVKYSRVPDRLCELGRFGQKTGLGWYRYEAGRRDALPDPVVTRLVEEESRALGRIRRSIGDAEIVDRCIFALVNEGARILEEGIAQRASDIDMVYLAGYGFPLHRGGPMFYADSVGLYTVKRAMSRFAADADSDPAFWTPAPLLEGLVAEGRTFN